MRRANRCLRAVRAFPGLKVEISTYGRRPVRGDPRLGRPFLLIGPGVLLAAFVDLMKAATSAQNCLRMSSRT